VQNVSNVQVKYKKTLKVYKQMVVRQSLSKN